VKYLLDTNICIYIIKKNPEKVFRRFREFQVGDVGISAITYSELEFGVENSSNPQRNREALYEFLAPLEIAPYPPEVAPVYGSLRTHLQRKGLIIGPMDLLIAAHASYLGCTLVTNNTSEFMRVPHLLVENWAR
jgi:tRNA(fMet)-specific endonuclease VapC